jgi:hypothetical protein
MTRGTIAAALMTTALGAILVAQPDGSAAELAVTGRSNANASIAASGSFVAIAWGATAGSTTDVYIASSRDGGRTFGRPARVNDLASSANLSGEQPPRVTLIPRAGHDPSVVVVWTAKGTTGTRLLSARSDDGGTSFGRPAAVPGTEAPGNRGWHAVATDRAGDIVAIWLDHRELAPSGSGAGSGAAAHDHAAHAARETDGVARAQRSKLFFANLSSARAAQPVTGGVCYCPAVQL